MAQSQTPTSLTLSAEQADARGSSRLQTQRVRRWLAFIARAWREGIEMYARGAIRRGYPEWFG